MSWSSAIAISWLMRLIRKTGWLYAGSGPKLSNTCHPRDVWAEVWRRVTFIDVQARGDINAKAWEREGITVEMTEEDLQLLKEHTVVHFLLLLCELGGFGRSRSMS